MKKYIWPVMAVGLMVGGWNTAQAASTDTVTSSDYNAAAPAVKDSHPKGKKHRRAEGTNRSSRPGTSTGVHSIGGNDTPAATGVPQDAATSGVTSSTTTY